MHHHYHPCVHLFYFRDLLTSFSIRVSMNVTFLICKIVVEYKEPIVYNCQLLQVGISCECTAFTKKRKLWLALGYNTDRYILFFDRSE